MSVWRANVRRASLWRVLTCMHFFAGVLVPFFTDWGGLTLPQVFLLQAWFFLWIFLLEVPTGAVADYLGRKASLVLSSVCLLSATALYASGKGLALYLLAEFIWAAAAAFASGADEAMVYDSLKAGGAESEAKAALARFSSLEIGAIAASAPIGGLMAAAWGLRAPMLLMTVPFALSIAVALSLREPPSAPEDKAGYVETLLRGVRYFRGHPALRALAFDSVTVWMLCFMTIWLYQPYLRQLGAPIVSFGFAAAGMTLSQILVLNNVERLERLFGGTRRYLAFSALLPGLCFLALPFATHPVAAAALIVTITGFGMSRSVLISSYMHKHVDSARRATVLSTVGMARQLTGVVVLPLVGLLTKLSLEWTFAALGAAVLLCAAASSVEEAHLPA